MQELSSLIPIKQFSSRLEEIDFLSNDPFIWSNPKKASDLMKERQKITETLDKFLYFEKETSFLTEALTQLSSQDLLELEDSITHLLQEMNDFEFLQLFKDPIDSSPAILTINSGAGGLEAANWVSMLYRMYARFADNQGFKIEILDEERSKEYSSLCIDSISLRIIGNYAYGFFKSEIGVHRLIRNSPFNADGNRHTSFAAVDVNADIEDIIDIKIEEKDIEVSAMRAGGSGGQAQNKVNSACRIKHLPTGINIAVRQERSFPQNKNIAMKMLKAKLYDLEKKKKDQALNNKIDNQSDISFGHQIRSYTESPQAIVKDERTDYQMRDFNRVLDGDIFDFIKSFLKISKDV